jgi:DNA-binding CsgD family transcriptional regulator
MLETIREFAREQLLASDETTQIRNAHAAWFSRLAEERRLPSDMGNESGLSDQKEPKVEVDYANVRAAITWFEESNNLPELSRIAGSIFWYWHIHGPRREGLTVLRKAWHASAETPRDKESRKWAMEGLSLLERNSGRFNEATAAALEFQRLAREAGDVFGESRACRLLGYIALAQGDYDLAESLSHQAIAKRTESGEGLSAGIEMIHLGQVAHGKGDLMVARALFDEALAVARHYGHQDDVAGTVGYLALLECEEGAHGEAAERLAEAIAIWRDLSNQENISEWLAEVAVLADATGNHDAGVRFLAAGTALRDAVEHAWTLPERASFERTEQSLRHALEPDDFARAYQAGLNQPLKKTLEEASAFLAHVQSTDGATAKNGAADASGLTPRELDVLLLLVRGKSDREIAEALFIGARTVETHVSNLLTKLGATNRTEATARALQNGLVDGQR